MQFDSASSAQRWRRSERLRLELALAVLCALLLPPGRTASAGVAGSPQHPPACEKLALCSAGKLQPYNGDLDVPGEMAKAVAARSYNKELILLTTSPGPADGSYPRNMWNMVAMQALGNLADMGYEHVLLLSTDGEACRKIAAMMPRYGCAYSTGTLFKKEDKGTTIVLWVLRYRTLVRAARLGVNVLSMDSDVTFFHDPYPFWKSEPFNKYHLLNQKEVVFEERMWDHTAAPNGGFIYVQNTQPNGAALWVMMEAIGRNLRWRGSKKWFYDTWGAFSSCEAVDQDGLLAALPSAFLGRPVFQYAIAGCLFEADPKRRSEKAKFAHHAHAIDADVALFRNRHPMASVKTPAEWLPVVGSDTYKLHGFPIQVPNTRGKSVDKYGPILYPPQTGALYDELIAQFKSDCPSCPLWPDPLDSSPASLAAIDALKQEQFLYLPSWFVTGYWPRGRYGYWNAALLPGGVPQQVVGHQHYNRQASTIEAKLVGRHAHRQFNWTLAHQLEGAAVYFSSRPGDKDLPTLVAYHPDLVDFRRTGSLVEMQSVLRGLAQVAALANRTVLWPDVPCNTSWAKTAPNGDVGVPLQLAQPVMPYVPHGGDGKHLTCMPWDYANPPCLDEGAAMRGMLQLEYEHLTAVAPPGSYPPPSEANTVFAHVAPEIRRAAGSVTIGANGRFVSTGPRGAVSGDMVNIASDDVASQLAAVAAASPDARIIYVGHPIHVHFTCRHNAQLHHYVFMQDRCPALKKGIQAAGGDASKLPSAKLVPQSTPTTLDARLAASKQVLTPTARLELPTCAH